MRVCRLRLQPHLQRPRRVRRRKASPRLPLPSAREASWMLLRSEELTDEEKKMVELLGRLSPEVRRAQQRSEVAEFVSFANGLTADL